jgi:hypothetical protein
VIDGGEHSLVHRCQRHGGVGRALGQHLLKDGDLALVELAPRRPPPRNGLPLCIDRGAQLVARLSANTIAVKATSAGTTIKPCP